MPESAECKDCGELYSDMGVDITFPEEQWKLIFPEESGLLCASCIMKRVEKIKNSIAVRAIIDFGNNT